MNNRMCEMFGIEAPIFAFSHCRDVVVEVSKADARAIPSPTRWGRSSPTCAKKPLCGRWCRTC